ncbi:MAG TPA: hypothetical protein VE422_44130 [Terriglobia bacterium]|nr:hypothetical protein [Terriglobia bacterium]
MRRVIVFAGILIVFSIALPAAYAQRGGRGAGGPPPTPKAAAPIDLTGTWVPLITEDWRVRMVTPKKGDYESVPISADGRKIADAWDPAKDEAAGEQCRSYAAPAIMRVPGRIRIGWENDNVLKIDTEAGTQTRRFLFGPAQQPPTGQPTFQGQSAANWENLLGGRGGQARTGNLKVVTTNLRPGYLRKNGVPYSANAVLTEYYDVMTGAPPNNSATYLVITTEVNDPQYLTQTFVTSTHFKKLAGNAAFTPEACTAK